MLSYNPFSCKKKDRSEAIWNGATTTYKFFLWFIRKILEILKKIKTGFDNIPKKFKFALKMAEKSKTQKIKELRKSVTRH